MDPPLNDNDTVRIDDSVCEDNATSFENGINESSWDFVEKTISIDSSDDDSSIVIIEREVQRQDSMPPSSTHLTLSALLQRTPHGQIRRTKKISKL